MDVEVERLRAPRKHGEAARAVEVMALFEDAVLEVAYVTAGAFTLGASAGVSLAMPLAVLPHDAFPLVRATAAGHELLLTPAMRGDVTVDGIGSSDGDGGGSGGDGAGRARLPIADAIASGRARPTATPDVFAWHLGDGARALVQLGEVSLAIASQAAPARAPLAPRLELGASGHGGAVALAVGLVLALAYAVPPEPGSLSSDAFLREARRARFLFAAPERPEPPPSPGAANGAPTSGGAATAERHAGAAGSIGSPRAPRRDGRLRLPATPDRRDLRQLAQLAAARSGLIGALAPSEGTHLGAVLGRDRLFGGSDLEAALGGLVGTQVGDGYGNGLALVPSGHGPGGGGSGDTIGPSLVPRGCHGPGCDGAGPPLRMPSHRPVAIEPFVPTVLEVKGWDPQLIRRVVRLHINEVRFCYDKELLRRPDLSGRVVVQFAIALDGRVGGAAIQSSTLSAPAVHACMTDAVRRWEFPRPPGHVVTVTYAFILKAPE